jgi:hypothetical protein
MPEGESPIGHDDQALSTYIKIERVLNYLREAERKEGTIDPETNEFIGFDMTDWLEVHPCGTNCCLAGHIVYALDPALYRSNVRRARGQTGEYIDMVEEAVRLTGLDDGDANAMFHGDATEGLARHLSDISLSDAIKMLEHFQATGKVCWWF